MIMIPEPKHFSGRGSNDSPTSVTQVWNKHREVRVLRIPQSIVKSAHVSFAETVKVREFKITPPLSPLEESDIWYSKRDFALFNAENRALAKAIRMCNRTGKQPVRPEVPELRGLEDQLSVRANLEAKGRHNRALTAVFIEQQRQQRDGQGVDAEAIRIASLKVTRQSLDIALYRGKMDHQRCMMPSPARIGRYAPVAAVENTNPADTINATVSHQIRRRSLSCQETTESTRIAKKTANCKPEDCGRSEKQRPALISQSSLRFREATRPKDTSPMAPRRPSTQTLRRPEIESPSSFAVGKPRRGRIVIPAESHQILF